MSVFVVGLVWVIGAAALAASVAFVIRKYGEDEGRAGNNEAAGAVFTLVGGLQAVMMAFVLIAQFDAVSDAGEVANREANSLVAVSWAGESLPEPTRSEVRALTEKYADIVINQEWPRLRAGTEVETAGWSTLDELRLTLEASEPADEWQQERRVEAASQLWELYQARQERLDAAGGGISTVVWFALVAGSVLSLALPYLFGGTRLVTHVIVASTLAATMALLMYSIYQMQNPFSGGASIEPDAFRSALQRLG